MQPKQFLAQPEVAYFIDWLVTNLPLLTFNLNFKASKHVPGGLRATVHGFENVLPHYHWGASWTDQHGVTSNSSDWSSTKVSLSKLRSELNGALSASSNPQVLAACIQVLRWGGVRGAIPFLKRLAATGDLVTYLRATQPLMALNSTISVSDLDATSIQRFDAGLTKIHSLLDATGSPIYDSRVGAAIGMLHSLFRKQYSGPVSLTAFPSGAARGSQLRNPGALGGLPAPQFGNISYAEWARCQVRLGWIIRAVLKRCTWFREEGGLAARCHAFEATLFILGYDLRCFTPVATTSAVTSTAGSLADENTSSSAVGAGWVPTGHPFTTVLQNYLDFRDKGHVDNKPTFVTWLVDNKQLKPATADSYCFAFSIQEFDLFQRPLEELKLIVAGGEAGLLIALGTDTLEPFVWSEERGHVCLVDVVLTGIAYRDQDTNEARLHYLVANGFAGTENAASTLLALGRNVGKHFDLLDKNNKPTDLFKSFFQNCDLFKQYP